MHAAGLLHRDVKAQNVMREEGGRIVLMDFGTGEDLRQQGNPARLVGTPLYLAPEIFEGKPASMQSDLYSVGVLLFYLVTGEFPVAAATMEQLKAAQGRRQIRRLRDVRPDLPSSFITVIDRALDPDPAARYASAGEMETALRDQPAQFRPVPLVAAVTPARYSRRAVMAACIAATLVLVAGLIAWQRFSSAPAPAYTTIAVLPFKDLSLAPTRYLAPALTDQLVATLGQIQSLRVTAPGSSAGFKGLSGAGGEIAKQLGVDAVVEGSVAAEPTAPNEPLRARVDTRVIRAGVSTPLWTGSIQWVAGDSKSLQAGLTRAIARAVNAAVTPGEAGRIDAARQTNPNAEEAYLRGRAELMAYGSDAARRALAEFQRALTFDPKHPGAYAGASRAYVVLGQFGTISEADARQSGLAAARTALELSDDLAEGHLAMADLQFFYDWNWAGAEREYLKTLELNPSLSRARRAYAELLAVVHRFPEAYTQAQIARKLDPQSSEASLTNAMVFLYGRRLADARAIVQDTLLQQPDSAAALLMQGRIADAQGQYGQALESVTHASELPGGNGVQMQLTLLQLQARSGRKDEARAGLAALEQQAAARKIRLNHRDRAYLKLALGDEAGATDEFEQSFEERESLLRWISVDPRLDPLRGNARFQAILNRMGLS